MLAPLWESIFLTSIKVYKSDTIPKWNPPREAARSQLQIAINLSEDVKIRQHSILSAVQRGKQLSEIPQPLHFWQGSLLEATKKL